MTYIVQLRSHGPVRQFTDFDEAGAFAQKLANINLMPDVVNPDGETHDEMYLVRLKPLDAEQGKIWCHAKQEEVNAYIAEHING